MRKSKEAPSVRESMLRKEMERRKGDVTFFSYLEKQESCMAAPLCKPLWVGGVWNSLRSVLSH